MCGGCGHRLTEEDSTNSSIPGLSTASGMPSRVAGRSIVAKTARTAHRFHLKEDASGQPWLVSELLMGDEPGGSGRVGLNLAPGTTMQQAEDLARTMNRLIIRTSFTQFQDLPRVNGEVLVVG